MEDLDKLTKELKRIADAMENKNKLEEKRILLEQKNLIFEKQKFKSDSSNKENFKG